MLDLKLTVENKRGRFGRRGVLNIDALLVAAGDHSVVPVNRFLELLLQERPDLIPGLLIPALNNPGDEEIYDLRGVADPDASPGTGSGTDRQVEELFRAEGCIFSPPPLPPLDDSARPEDGITELPFLFRINTHFLRFEGSRHIVYGLRREHTARLDPVSDFIDGPLLARMFPARLDRFHLSLENFVPHSFGAMFGLVPVVESSLRLVTAGDRIHLRVRRESGSGTAQPAFAEQGIIPVFSRALQSSGLYPVFERELAVALERA